MIEVREYIRTKEGQIYKADEIFLKHANVDIKSHSKKPIELVEVGDIVEIQNKLDGIKTIFNLNEYTIDIYKEQLQNGSVKLTSILTHEMYEQNCYKVGAENE